MGHCVLLRKEGYHQRFLVNTGAQYTIKRREEAQRNKEKKNVVLIFLVLSLN